MLSLSITVIGLSAAPSAAHANAACTACVSSCESGLLMACWSDCGTRTVPDRCWWAGEEQCNGLDWGVTCIVIE